MPSATRARSPRAARPAAPQAPKLGGGTVKLDAAAFGARFNRPLVHETVRAELACSEAGAPPPPRPGGRCPVVEPSPGARRAPARPGWVLPFTGVDRRRHRVRPIAAPVHLQDQPQGAPGERSQRPSGHAERDSLAVFDASKFDAPSTSQAARLLGRLGPGRGAQRQSC